MPERKAPCPSNAKARPKTACPRRPESSAGAQETGERLGRLRKASRARRLHRGASRRSSTPRAYPRPPAARGEGRRYRRALLHAP
jgi:hypothetical protein